MINPYYPETNTGRADWWDNLLQNGTAVLNALNAPTALINKVNADATAGLFLYRTLPALYDSIGKKINGYIKTYLYDADGTPAPQFPTIPPQPSTGVPSALAGVEARRELWVKAIKALDGYDAAVQGVALQFEPTGTPFDAATYKAEITGVSSPSARAVVAGFRKARGNIVGVKFFGRKIGTTTLMDLGGLRTVSPTTLEIPIATPGVAEEWEIQARAVVKDDLVGIASDFAPVLVRG